MLLTYCFLLNICIRNPNSNTKGNTQLSTGICNALTFQRKPISKNIHLFCVIMLLKFLSLPQLCNHSKAFFCWEMYSIKSVPWLRDTHLYSTVCTQKSAESYRNSRKNKLIIKPWMALCWDCNRCLIWHYSMFSVL